MDSSPICHLSPAKKNEMLIFGLCSTSDDQLDWSMDSNAIHHPSPAKNMKCLFLDYIQLLMISQACRCSRTPFATSLQPKEWNAHFWIMFNFWWSARLVNGLESHLPPLSSQKHDMLIFGLRSTSDDWPGWSMDSNPIHHLSPAKKMKCLFLDYIHLLMIGKAGWWTRTPSATHLQPKTWNAHFWIMFNFWWSDGLVDGLKLHLQPLCSQKNEMLIFGLRSISDDRPGWLMDLNPIHHPSASKKMKCSFLDYVQLLMIGRAGRCTQIPSATSLQPKIWNAHFKIMFNFWRLAGLVDGLKQHLQLLCSQKNEMLIFGLHSTSDYWLGRSMDSNPISSQNNEMLIFGLHSTSDYWLGRSMDSNPISSQNNEMLIFGLCSTSDDQLGWSMDSNPVCHPSPATKRKCSFLDYIQLLMISWLVNGLEPHMPPLSSQKNEMLIFGLHSTSDDWLGWSMDSNPIYHPSPAKKMKYLLLDYVQHLIIGQAGRWT